MQRLIGMAVSVLVVFSLFFTGCTDTPVETDPYADIPETSSDEFELSIKEDFVAIRRYIGDSTTVKVPAEIDGKPVTLIGMDSFMNTKVETVILPDSVTEIRESAFLNCRELKHIRFSNNLVLIENNAFEKCSNLTSVELSGAIQKIEQYAFSECTALTTVELNGTDLFIGMAAFAYNPLLKEVTMSGVKTIGWAAFQFAGELESVTIPETVEEIDGIAFANCDKLADVTFLGDLPESIDDYTFKSEKIVATLHHKPHAKGLDNPDLAAYTLKAYE